MWGNISTEAMYLLNFNVGFSTTRSDVLVHLAQWQYWWWFWFAFIWSFYYLMASRVARYRTLKMRPKIVTSFRPHGKWGDFLAAILPVSWCLNILTNSNFILRLLEWQNEASLFTVRVRARQWYWVYKFELKNVTDILVAPKNLGRNRWVISVFGDLQVSDDYLHILQLRSQNRWIKGYWSSLLNNLSKPKKNHLVVVQEQLNFFNKNETTKFDFSNLILNDSLGLDFNNNNKIFFMSNSTNNAAYLNLKKKSWEQVNNFTFLGKGLNSFFSEEYSSRKNNQIKLSIYSNLINFDKLNFFKAGLFSDFDQSSRLLKKSAGIPLPIRLIKNPFIANIENSFNKDDFNFFRIRFSSGENELVHKTVPHSTYLTLKQKKYKRKKFILPTHKFQKDSSGLKTKTIRYSGKPILLNNEIFEQETNIDRTIQYHLIMKNKKRSDLMPVTLAKRILRVKKTLILPAHMNITLITNSYDIVHSWFIPGLGLKIDCVPGRSTHHTFFIDSVGMYYGQCAEICGRYHHHMPIRVCALPFEHFLVWWHTFGLPKLLFTNNQRRFESSFSFRKFTW